MKTYVLAVIVSLVMAWVNAYAAETGVINQSGPYEATMRFYLDPAHGFPGTPETAKRQSVLAGADAAPKPATARDRNANAVQKPAPVRMSSR